MLPYGPYGPSASTRFENSRSPKTADRNCFWRDRSVPGALAQRYVMANGRVQHFTDEQMRWLEDLRPKALLAEKQRALHESMNKEQANTDDLTSLESDLS